jgi:hypothetical protein
VNCGASGSAGHSSAACVVIWNENKFARIVGRIDILHIFVTNLNTHAMKKTLVIHPKDFSTDFLSPIYAPVKNKKVITGGVSKDEVRELIKSHDRIMMMGHGTPMGLMSINRFGPDARGYIIDESMVEVLKDKECVFIWCNADEFVNKYNLKGFYSGMFISEYGEAYYCGVRYVRKGQVEESNDRFAAVVSSYINKGVKKLYESVRQEYGVLAETNPIASYNNERIYLRI